MNPLVVLASSSPRRANLLKQIGIAFRVKPVTIDETVGINEDPKNYASRLALAKAQLAQPEDIPIIGVDTTVVLEGEILGKPQDKSDAERMLLNLSGSTHQVITAIAVCDHRAHELRLAEASVTFRNLSKVEISNYIRTSEPNDKAGSYGIQGIGGIFVERIIGQPSTVIGLPLLETEELLVVFGVKTWIDR